MNKKILGVLIVVAILAITCSREFTNVKALQVHIDGHDDAYLSSKTPDFCECYHSTQQYWQDDTEVGLGVSVLSTTGSGFTSAFWHFDAESGGSGAYLNAIDLPLYCTDAAQYYGGNYYCYTQPVWGYLPWSNYQCLYTYSETSGSFTASQWVRGETQCWFHEFANPSHTWMLDAWTQPPSYDQDGNGPFYLTWNNNDANDIR